MNDRNNCLVSALLPMALALAPMGCAEGENAGIEVHAQALDSSRLYGTYCQEDFQNGWRPTLPGSWSTCSNFNSAMNNLAPRSFYFSLSGAAWHFEDSGDQENGGGLDGVDVVFVHTHGGAWTSPVTATQTMFEQNSRSLSTAWRLGDENRGLSLFATHSCETLKNDGNLASRWVPAFDGGLRLAVGSHDTIFSSSSSTGDGQRFADNMRNGQLVGDAWKNAMAASSLDQDVAVLATGADSANCWSRLDSIKWSNLTTTPRLRDAAWQSWCQRQWDNL